jgi:hypothetical protein
MHFPFPHLATLPIISALDFTKCGTCNKGGGFWNKGNENNGNNGEASGTKEIQETGRLEQ